MASTFLNYLTVCHKNIPFVKDKKKRNKKDVTFVVFQIYI